MTQATWTATLVAVTPQPFAGPTFTELGDLRYGTLNVSDELDGPGSAEVVCSVDSLSDDMKLRLKDVGTAPCELWVWREGVKVFAGKVFQPRRGDGRDISLPAKGLLFYLAYMASDVAYVVRDRDQTTIVQELVDAYQALEYGNFGLDTATLTPTGVLRDLTYLVSPPRTFDAVFSEMGGRSEGFDLWADPATRRVYTISPWRGADLSTTVIIDSRQILDAQWGASCAPGQFATDIIATSSTPTGGSLLARAGNAELRAAAGRLTAVQGFYDITQQGTLDAHASQLIADLGVQVEVVGSQLLPVDMAYGSVMAGESVTFSYDFGLGPTSTARRLRRVSASVTSAGERISVEFV